MRQGQGSRAGKWDDVPSSFLCSAAMNGNRGEFCASCRASDVELSQRSPDSGSRLAVWKFGFSSPQPRREAVNWKKNRESNEGECCSLNYGENPGLHFIVVHRGVGGKGSWGSGASSICLLSSTKLSWAPERIRAPRRGLSPAVCCICVGYSASIHRSKWTVCDEQCADISPSPYSFLSPSPSSCRRLLQPNTTSSSFSGRCHSRRSSPASTSAPTPPYPLSKRITSASSLDRWVRFSSMLARESCT